MSPPCWAYLKTPGTVLKPGVTDEGKRGKGAHTGSWSS